ncbi:uncharacterized protein LOC100574670 isoform X1 [Acyrthosiphon pisum]|uniref:Uncharacterized protein n=1 Tax=Acyrthosiphon pisum TaxID=7029 RepID=A0A8R1W518_ACYPI|nr:uncharacterized protein LOC100574670 isoform X1 [Acyrthosiphon pisum]|eukprot:XP_003243367.1 PREDICTED: uncharacterized protein LOC100574670 isoform X1 [Acyrthosiphon pisum]
MDAVKLEAKWPPDRKSTIEASEFGIYKEPSDGKRLRTTDKATGCLLVLSLIAAAAVVLYFSFYDYTVPTTQGASTGPIVNYAKYVKERNTMTTQMVNRPTDGLLTSVLGVQNAENYTARALADDVDITKRFDDGKLGNGRHMRLYPQLASQHPEYLSYDSNYWRTDLNKNSKLEYTDSIYGFNRRSDFPQLAAYRAPFPPKSILDVMKYVTGAPHKANIPEYMIAQESKPHRYYPIRPAEEVNRFLPDVNTPSANLRRFRNKFGPPVFLTPPIMSFPDDFMKPPDLDARYSMDFENDIPLDLTLQEGSASVPSHTGVIFRPPFNDGYPVPDSPKPKKVKNKRKKKPISVMLDIYPLSDSEHENEQAEEEDEERHSEMITSLKNNVLHSDSDKLLFSLNLFPKFSEGGRRISKNVKYEEQDDHKPIIHLTTHKPLQVDKGENDEDKKLFEDEYSSESKNIANISKTQ